MSGPKVVRIVTREEMIAICERLLAQLDAAIKEWLRVGERNELIDSKDRASISVQRAELRRALARDEFSGFQKAVPKLIEWLHSDMQRRFDASVTKEARLRK